MDQSANQIGLEDGLQEWWQMASDEDFPNEILKTSTVPSRLLAKTALLINRCMSDI